MKRICSICVRAGSEGVKGKNSRFLAGKPLYQHSLEQARGSNFFDWIVVSTDDTEILETACELGADQVISRPVEMATATAGKLPAIKHAVEMAEKETGHSFDYMVDLDATAPLRLPADIIGAVKLLEESVSATNVITGKVAHRSPYFNLVEREGDERVRLSKTSSTPIIRRQDAPACFDMNASIYVWHRKSFFPMPKVFDDHTLLYEMPAERSLDIDTELDFEIVSYLMSKNNEHSKS